MNCNFLLFIRCSNRRIEYKNFFSMTVIFNWHSTEHWALDGCDQKSLWDSVGLCVKYKEWNYWMRYNEKARKKKTSTNPFGIGNLIWSIIKNRTTWILVGFHYTLKHTRYHQCNIHAPNCFNVFFFSFLQRWMEKHRNVELLFFFVCSHIEEEKIPDYFQSKQTIVIF